MIFLKILSYNLITPNGMFMIFLKILSYNLITPNGMFMIFLKFYFSLSIYLNFVFYMAGRNMEDSFCI